MKIKESINVERVIIVVLLLVIILIGAFAYISSNSSKDISNTPAQKNVGTSLTVTQTSTPTPSTSPLKVTSIDLSAHPSSITGIACGSNLTVTYSATFHVLPNNPGGTIGFMWTGNNGRSSTDANVAIAAGETVKTYTFSVSGTLSPDNTFPGIAEVITSKPNAINSPQVKPAGTCH